MALCEGCLPVSPSSSSSCPTCLQIPSLYVACNDSVEPSEAGQVDVSENVTSTPCSGDIFYEITDFPAAFFSAATIDSATGIISFTIDAAAVAGTTGVITGKGWCTKTGGGVLSQFFTVTVCAKQSIPV